MSGAGNAKKNEGTDGGIAKRKAARTTKQAAENAAAATIADRLTNRAKTQTVDVSMQDDAGEFTIPMQVPSLGVTYDLTQFEEMMQDQKGRERMAALMTDLSVDPSMDYDFWLNGTIGLLDLRLLISGLTSASLERMNEAKSFRKK
jgi:hypothetical protein